MSDLSAPSYNRIILTGVVQASRLYSHADGRQVFRFTLGTRRLRMDEQGEKFLGWDWHHCQISGPKQCEKAAEHIKRGSWLHLEGNVKYDEQFRNTPQYVRRATVKVEYWQPIKEGDVDARPDVREVEARNLPGSEEILKVQQGWDDLMDHKDTGVDSRETRS